MTDIAMSPDDPNSDSSWPARRYLGAKATATKLRRAAAIVQTLIAMGRFYALLLFLPRGSRR
jgi:hypothetical protein